MDVSDGISSSGSQIRMQLQVLPNRLRVGRIAKEDLALAALPLLKLVLFPSQQEPRFVSLTHTTNELSVIIDEQDLASFPKSVIQLSDRTFRALQISEGSLGFTAFGIVQSWSVPLAAAGISIFYLSTFETDLTLIPENNLQQALEVLSSQFVLEVDEGILADLPPQETCKPSPGPPVHHPLLLPPGELYLASIKKNHLPALGTYLMNLLFLTGPQQTFYSYTETDDEVSVVLTKEAASLFPEEAINMHTERWRLLQVDSGDKPLGFDEAGIVSSIADPLAKARLSLFYISTFSTDYTLVLHNDVATAIKVLEESNFNIKS